MNSLFLLKILFLYLNRSLYLSERIKQEKNIIDEEKRSFDENVQKDLEIKKAKLIEILVIF